MLMQKSFQSDLQIPRLCSKCIAQIIEKKINQILKEINDLMLHPRASRNSKVTGNDDT